MNLDLCGRRVSFQEMGSSSFAEFLSSYAPQLLPGGSPRDFPAGTDTAGMLSHATTIVAVACDEGVVLASDRRATAGNMISKRDVEKVFRCDEFSAVGVAGVLALALELAKLFQIELEHYEKMEGRSLTLEGKAHRLAAMIRGNLGLAMQGLVMVPLLAGYDLDSGAGRIFSYDPAGGPLEEHRFHSIRQRPPANRERSRRPPPAGGAPRSADGPPSRFPVTIGGPAPRHRNPEPFG
jgi:proteasome beta subunit